MNLLKYKKHIITLLIAAPVYLIFYFGDIFAPSVFDYNNPLCIIIPPTVYSIVLSAICIFYVYRAHYSLAIWMFLLFGSIIVVITSVAISIIMGFIIRLNIIYVPVAIVVPGIIAFSFIGRITRKYRDSEES